MIKADIVADHWKKRARFWRAKALKTQAVTNLLGRQIDKLLAVVDGVDCLVRVDEINSAGIEGQAFEDDVLVVEKLAEAGKVDHQIVVYQYDGVLVIDTNGDPVWEETDPAGFHALLEEYNIILGEEKC